MEFLSLLRVVDVALGFLVLEAFVLLFVRRHAGLALRAADFAPTWIAGGCLLLALRASLSGAGTPWVLWWLTGALFAHLADLVVKLSNKKHR